jgi:branched-chain amino acid transport system substrate-binding protein
MTTRSKVVRSVVALALVALAAACSSSGKPASTGGSTPSQSAIGAKPATGVPIKVGLICSCSGATGSAYVPSEDVYKAWVNTVNGSGGINGHPIQLTTEDDAGSPGTSLGEGQTLISEHVNAIVDMSVVDQTWASAVQAAQIPVIGHNIFDVPMFTNPDFYPEGQTADSQGIALILTLKAAGATSFGDIYCVEAVACTQYNQAQKTAGSRLGIPLTFSTAIAATAPNYTAPCLAAQQKQVKYLIVADDASIIVRFAKDCDRQGYDPTYIIGGSSYSPQFGTTPGMKADTLSPYANLPDWVNSPAVQAMNTAVDKYYPGLRQNPTLWQDNASEAWPSGLLLEDAVKAGGLGPTDTPSAAAIIKGLESLKGDTLDGWAPPLTFSPGQPHPVDCWFTGRLQNGVPELLNNGQTTCENS